MKWIDWVDFTLGELDTLIWRCNAGLQSQPKSRKSHISLEIEKLQNFIQSVTTQKPSQKKKYCAKSLCSTRSPILKIFKDVPLQSWNTWEGGWGLKVQLISTIVTQVQLRCSVTSSTETDSGLAFLLYWPFWLLPFLIWPIGLSTYGLLVFGHLTPESSRVHLVEFVQPSQKCMYTCL